MTASFIRRERRKRPCPCGCGTVGFCPDHAELIAGIRDDFKAKRAAKSRDGLRARSTRRPQCCRPGCSHDRTPPAAFCDQCTEDGWEDGVGE